jgi:hypothetical protein
MGRQNRRASGSILLLGEHICSLFLGFSFLFNYPQHQNQLWVEIIIEEVMVAPTPGSPGKGEAGVVAGG